MADNPFYFGSVNNTKDEGMSNPLFSGYYAGKALPKKPKSRDFIKPLEYNFDDLLTYVDNFTDNVTNMPKWVGERIVDDFKQNLKAAYKPEDVPIEALDDYDADMLPGVASISISLNPEDWKDPGKQASKTLNAWGKALTGIDAQKRTVDFSDYENRTTPILWRKAVGLPEPTDPKDPSRRVELTGLAKEAAKAIEERTFVGKYVPQASLVYESQDSPTTLVGSNLLNSMSRSDVFEDVASGIVEFEQNLKSGIKRDAKHDMFLQKSVVAIDEELQYIKGLDTRQRIIEKLRSGQEVSRDEVDYMGNFLEINDPKGRNIHSANPIFSDDLTSKWNSLPEGNKAFDRDTAAKLISKIGLDNNETQILQRLGNNNGVTTERYNEILNSIDVFHEKRQIAEDINTMYFRLNGPAGIVTKLNNTVIGVQDTSKTFKYIDANGNQVLSMGSYLMDINEKCYGNSKNLIPEYLAQRGFFTTSTQEFTAETLKQTLSEHKRGISEALGRGNRSGTGVLNGITLNQRDIEELQNYKGLLDGAKDMPGLRDTVGKLLDKDVTGQSKILAKVRKQISYAETLSTPSGKEYLGVLKDYERFLSSLESNLQDFNYNDLRLSLNKLKNVSASPFIDGKLTGGTMFAGSVQRRFLRHLEKDILLPGDPEGNVMQVGKLLDTDLKDLGLYSNRVKAYARRLIIERRSAKMDEAYDAITQGRFLERYIWPEIVVKITGYTPAEITQELLKKVHYFGLVVDDSYVTSGQRTSALFNKLFKYKFGIEVDGTKYNLEGNQALKIIGVLDGFGKMNDSLTSDEIMGLLTGRLSISDPSIYSRISHFTDDKLFNMQLSKFQIWLLEKFGIDLKNLKPGEEGKVKKILDALIKENNGAFTFKIAKEYWGAMDRLGTWLNELQRKIFKSETAQKLFKQFFQLKTLIVEKVSKFVSEFLLKLAGAATGGTATAAFIVFEKLVQKVIEPAIRFTVKKFMDWGEAFFKGLLQGDLGLLMRQMSKEAEAIIKFALNILFLILLLFSLPVLLIEMVTVGSISPIDPTKSNAGYGVGAYGYEMGENQYVKVVKDVYVETSEGTFQNPTEPIANELLKNGITVRYEIKITPKKTITDGSVSYSDIAKIYKSNQTSRELIRVERVPLTTFVAGETIVIDNLPEIRLNQGDEDSMVMNIATVHMPGIQDYAVPEDVSYPRYFRIGGYISECPLVGEYERTTISYNGNIGHGSNPYWDGVAGADAEKKCLFAIPWSWSQMECSPTNGDGNMCAPSGDDSNYCAIEMNYPKGYTQYGYALDVSPSTQSFGGNYEVVLPAIGDPNREWTLDGSCHPNSGGAGGYGIVATSSDGKYKIYFTHLASGGTCSGTLKAGDKVGTLYTGWLSTGNIHLHIELIDLENPSAGNRIGRPELGTPLRPEDIMCQY